VRQTKASHPVAHSFDPLCKMMGDKAGYCDAGKSSNRQALFDSTFANGQDNSYQLVLRSVDITMRESKIRSLLLFIWIFYLCGIIPGTTWALSKSVVMHPHFVSGKSQFISDIHMRTDGKGAPIYHCHRGPYRCETRRICVSKPGDPCTEWKTQRLCSHPNRTCHK